MNAHERLMSNPEFWKIFFPLFRDEAMVREFAAITGLSEQRIKAARQNYLRQFCLKMSPHIHTGTGTVN
jgi:hypothetical protein